METNTFPVGGGSEGEVVVPGDGFGLLRLSFVAPVRGGGCVVE